MEGVVAVELVVESVDELGHVLAGLGVVDEGGVGASCSPDGTAFGRVAEPCDARVKAVEFVNDLSVTCPYFKGLVEATCIRGDNRRA